MAQILANKPPLSVSSGIWLGDRKAQGFTASFSSCSFYTCFDRLSVLPLLSSLLSPTRKVVRLAAVLLLSAFTLCQAPSNSRAATVAIFGVSTVQDAGGTLLADGVLVRVGTFGVQTDTTIRSYFTADAATTRTNLEGNFSVFGSGTLTGGQIFFDPTETVELNYDTAPGAQATYGDKDIYVMIFNNAAAGSATQVGLFRGIVDPNSGRRVYRFATDNTQGSDLEFSPLFIETMFGNFQTPGDGTYQLGALNRAYGITSALTATGTRNNAFSYAITANNGPTSYSTSALPTGLNVSAATGLISGTPTAAAGDYIITIRATGASGTVEAALTLTVQNPAGGVPSITSNTADQTATAGVVFPSYTITGSDSPTSYGASGLPTGLIVDTNTGVISGTATQTGTFTVTITATNGSGSGSSQFNLTVAAPTLSFSNKAFTLQTADTTAAPTPTTGFVPTAYTLQSGTVPAGLTLDAGTGRISGTPTQTAAATLTIRGTRAGVTADGTITVTVNTALATINSASTFSATKGTSLATGSGNYQITTATSASVVAPTSFVIVSGSLPSGLTLNTSTGVISGTPNAEGVFTVGLAANNSAAQGGGNGPTFYLTITVDVSPLIVQPEYTLYYRVGQSVNSDNARYDAGPGVWYADPSVGFYLSGSIPPGITNKLPLGTGFSGTPSSPGNYTSAITYSKLNRYGSILEAVQPVKIRVNLGTQAFYGMDGNLDGGPAGRALTGQVAGYFSDRFERPNSSVKVSTGSGLVHSNPQTEVVDQFSLSLWFKMPETPIPASGAYLIKGNPSVDAVSIKLIPSTTSSRVRLVLENVKSQNSNDNSGLFSGNQFTTPEIEGWSSGSGWHHIVFKPWGGGEMIYLDGVGLSRLGYWHYYLNFAPSAFDLNNFSIGGNPWSTDAAPFAGEIDEVGVYDIPLEETDLSLFEMESYWGYDDINPLGDSTVESLYLHGLANAGGGKLTVFQSQYHSFGYHLATAFQSNRIVDLDVGMFTVSGLDSNGRPMLPSHYPSFMRSPGDPALGVPPPSIVSGLAELRSGVVWHLALKKDAKAYYVGLGSYGDLNLITPHQVSLKSSSAVALAAGSNHAMILKTDGSLDVWHPITEPTVFLPEPEALHLGQTSVPVAATHLVAIAAGSNHCVALDREGRVFAWGDNSSGQCDVPIAAQANIVKIAAGGDFSMALTRDGRVLFWGLQDVAVGSPEAFQGKYRFIDVGDNGSLGALTEDGRLVTWLRGNAEMQRIWDYAGVSQFLPSYGGFSGISRFKMGGWTVGESGSEFPVIIQASSVPSWKMNFPLKLIGRPGIPFSFELSSVADLPPGQTHRFEAIGLPSGVILDAGSGILSAPNGLPTQAQTVTLVVRNDNGLDRRSVSLQAEDPVGIQLLARNPQESQNTVLLATLRLPAGWQLSPISVVQPYVAREVYGGWEIWSRTGLDYENPQERIVSVSVSATDPLGGSHSTSVDVALLNNPWEDADGDTVREYFEDLYGSSDRLPDTDGDGVSDWQEIQAGTSPKNPAVRPGSGSAFGDNHNGKFRFRFHAGIGKWVTVQSSEDLINWSSETLSEGELVELYPGFEGDGEIWEAEFPISSSKQFYRTQQTNFRPVSR